MKVRVILFLLAAAVIFSLPAGAASALHAVNVMEKRTFSDSAGTSLPYQIYIPPSDDAGEKFPLLLYLHGAGHRGSENAMQVYFEPGILARVLNEYGKCILVAPQCPDEMQWVDTPWENGSYSTDAVPESQTLRAVYELLLSLIESAPIDTDRIYVTGLSMGGYGTWDLIIRHPELFAAAVPICGAGDPTKAEVIANLPIRIYHGSLDEVVPVSGSRDMAKALEKVGSIVYTYTEYPGVGHSSWEDVYAEPDLLKWLFAQSKSGNAESKESKKSDGVSTAYIIGILLIAGSFSAMQTKAAKKRRENKN